MIIIDKVRIANALREEMGDISLLKISILSFPFAILIKFKIAMAKVLVLTPPPVDPGEAPIHINNRMIKVVEKCNDEVSTVLNPAVRGVAAPKNAVTILPIDQCSAKVLLNSNI